MEAEDRFCWITKLCQRSFSEDSSSRRCSYFGQSDSDISGSDSGREDPPDIPVASTGIIMASPDNDGDTVSAHADSSGSTWVVDLEVQVDPTQRSEADSGPKGADRRESEEMLVSKRWFSTPEGQSSSQPPSKKLKSLGSLKRCTDEQTGSELELEDGQNLESKAEVGEGSVGEKRVDLSTEVVECGTEEISIGSRDDNDEGNSGRNEKSVEGVGGNGMQEKTERFRVLPPWANVGEGLEETVEESVQADTDEDGMSEDFEEIADEELNNLSEDFEEPTLLDVLLDLEEDPEDDHEEDRSLACLSLLEVAQRKWGKEDFMAKK